MNGNTVAVLPDAIAKGQTITQMIPLLHVTMKIRVLHVANGSSKKKKKNTASVVLFQAKEK